MAGESKAATNPESQATVELGDPASLERWAEALKVTPEALRSAVQAVGPRGDRIKDYLTAGMAGDQEGG